MAPSPQNLGRPPRVFDTPGTNRLLSALPPEELDRLTPHLERVSLQQQDLLHSPNDPIHTLHFPLSCVLSILNVLEDGETIEVGTIGNEGFEGIPVLLETERVPTKVICQVPGEAYRIRTEALLEAYRRESHLHSILLRYAQQFFNQVAQTAACNRAHPVEERCARWLLMTHDRVGKDEFLLTQEFLAYMLGVRRSTVTLAAGILKNAGLIRYTRGILTILNREELEEASCECYQKIRQEFDRHIPG